MEETTQVILSVEAKQYANYLRIASEKFIEEVKPRLRNVPVVCWNQTRNAFEIPSSEFSWGKLTLCKHHYERPDYDPALILNRVEKIVQENDITTFEFILFTHFVDHYYNWESFGIKLRTSSFYSNIKLVTLFLYGADPKSVPLAFFRAFLGLPVKVLFQEFFLEIPKDNQVTNFSSRPGDYHRFLDNLGQHIYLKPITKAQKGVLIQTLKAVEKNFLDDICRRQRACLRPFGDRSSGETLVRGLVESRQWAKLKKFHDETLKRQWPMLAHPKFKTLYDLLEKSEITFEDFRCFIPSQLYSCRTRLAFKIVNQEEAADITDTPDRVPLCIVDQMDPEAPAIHYAPEMTLFLKDSYECEECPFLLLAYFNMVTLNNDITCYRRAGDYKKPVVKEDEEEEINEYQRTGIILYKFQNLDNPESELLKPKTREDDVIVETIRAFTELRYRARRNRGLVAIVFLFALYITDKVQNDEFFKKCIKYTIIRFSLIYKCNLPIFQSECPHIYVRIYDALIYAVHVSSVESNRSKNFYSRIKAAGPHFVLLMESIFQQKFPQPFNVRCWLALDYMSRICEDDKISMEAVAMTKVVGWIHTAKGPLLLRGKKSDKCYHEILDGLSATDVFKLKKLAEDRVLCNNDIEFDFSLADVDITVTLPSVKPDTPLEEVYFKHVSICHSTCRPTINCQDKGAPWKECLPKELRQPHLSFLNLFAKYCKEYEKYPTDADMMAYLAKSFPLECFYQNTQAILGHITAEFKQMNLEIATFLERFEKSKILKKRTQTEADCKCPAHNPVSIKHPQPKGISVSTKHQEPKGIYVLVFAFNFLFIILTCWLYL